MVVKWWLDMSKHRMNILTALPAAAAIAVTCGCTPSATVPSFDSPNPATKAYAIEDTVRTHDESAIPSLIEQLASDDPLIRMMAITSLKRLTGETLGYRHYDPPHVRNAAIARWVAWARENGHVSARRRAHG